MVIEMFKIWDEYINRAKEIIDKINRREEPLPFHINPDKYKSKYVISPYHYMDPRKKPHYRVIKSWIIDHLDPTDSILEVGCAAGIFGLWLRELGYRNYIGVDINEMLIDVGKLVEPSLDLICMDGRELKFKDNSFTFVGYMNNFYDHDPPFFVKEGLRVADTWFEFDGLDAEWLWETEKGTRGYKYLPKREEILAWVSEHKLILDSRIGHRHIYILEVQH